MVGPSANARKRLPSRLRRGHRTDVQIGYITHVGDAEALASHDGHCPV